MKEKLISTIELRKDELFNLLGDLVKINSENFASSGNELECAEFVRDYLTDIGVENLMYSPDDIKGIKEHPDYLAGRALENRPNTTGIIRSKDSKRSLMLAGHSDTTPIGNISAWSFPPLSGEVRDGKILGRGACDDKYAIAASLFLMKLIKEYNIELNYVLLFTAYSDEEYGGGNGTLAACLKYKCDDYLNLDCKNFEIWSSGVGGGEVMFEIKGLTPLDSCSDVIDGLVILKRKLLEFGKKREEELMKEERYKDTKIPQTAARFMEARAGNHGSDLNCGHIIMTFYTSKTEPGIMAEFETMRTELDEELKSIGFRVSSIKMITRFFHFAQCDLDNYAMDTLIKSAREVSGRELTPCGACLSDLSLFIKYGSSKAFSFGIGRDFNEYGGAHQTDEFIECDNLLEFTKILAAFLLNY